MVSWAFCSSLSVSIGNHGAFTNSSISLLKPRAISLPLRTRPNQRAIVIAKSGGDDNNGKHAVQISRRQVIQILNGLLGAMTLSLLVKMKDQFRLISPQAILSTLGLGRMPSRVAALQPASASELSEKYKDALAYVEKIAKRPPIECPDFPKSADWINSKPLALKNELKGKVVLLDFFTYCCINCQHVLPKLRELEVKYGQDGSGGVVVVGVHSAKFTAERETRNVAAAVERYDVQHPVVNDESMELWNAIGVSSWPTLALLGPQGNVLAVWSGERQEEDIDLVIAAALDYYSDKVDHRPLPAAPKRNSFLRRPSDSPFRYPGKLVLSEDEKDVFISDSGNNRIARVNLSSGAILQTYGSGEPALVDSSDPLKAAFHSPQGLAVYDGSLYVADTESHAVRVIDLKSGSVSTIGGTGVQGFDYYGGRVGKEQVLSSPWDLEVANGVLYVAMAGTHQIWSLNLPQSGSKGAYTAPWTVFSGSGRELEKNTSNGRNAGWAQPSHLSYGSNEMLYVADSESSSVRAIDMGIASHPTQTLAGGDGMLAENLFAFGDKEGRGARARFQHPLAVAFDSSKNVVYVADSYNHRIKVVDESGFAQVLCGSGSPGLRDGSPKDAMFWEPAGLALSSDGSKLYVSDTNNCAIRVVDMSSKAVKTIEVKSAPASSTPIADDKPLIANRRRAVQIDCDAVSPKGVLSFTLSLPEASHFTPGTISRFQANIVESASFATLVKDEMSRKGQSGSFQIDLSKYSQQLSAGGRLEIEAVTYYCTDEDNVCRTEADIFNVQLEPSGKDVASVNHTIGTKKRAETTSIAGGMSI